MEHGSITAMVCAKFQNDSTTDMYVIEESVLVKFEFKSLDSYPT